MKNYKKLEDLKIKFFEIFTLAFLFGIGITFLSNGIGIENRRILKLLKKK